VTAITTIHRREWYKFVRLDLTPTQRRICEAAVELFAAYGYHGTTMEQIADKAGMSRPTPFRAFKTKHNLFNCAVAMALEHAGLNGAVTPDDAEFEAAIRGWAKKMAGALAKDSRAIRLIYYAGLDHPETIRKFLVEFMAPMYDRWLELLLRAKHAGKVRKDVNPYAAIRALHGVIIYHYTHVTVFRSGKLHKFHLQPSDIEQYVDIWLRGVCVTD
jgi:AcrR family transcriptional regulator